MLWTPSAVDSQCCGLPVLWTPSAGCDAVGGSVSNHRGWSVGYDAVGGSVSDH